MPCPGQQRHRAGSQAVHQRLTRIASRNSHARDLIQAVAQRLLRSFTSNLESLLAGNAPSAPRPLGVFALLTWALIRARLFGR